MIIDTIFDRELWQPQVGRVSFPSFMSESAGHHKVCFWQTSPSVPKWSMVNGKQSILLSQTLCSSTGGECRSPWYMPVLLPVRLSVKEEGQHRDSLCHQAQLENRDAESKMKRDDEPAKNQKRERGGCRGLMAGKFWGNILFSSVPPPPRDLENPYLALSPGGPEKVVANVSTRRNAATRDLENPYLALSPEPSCSIMT